MNELLLPEVSYQEYEEEAKKDPEENRKRAIRMIGFAYLFFSAVGLLFLFWISRFYSFNELFYLTLVLPLSLMLVASIGMLTFRRFGMYLGIGFSVVLIAFLAILLVAIILWGDIEVTIGAGYFFAYGLIVVIATLYVLVKHRYLFK
jgi:magnesium-transporting ATPase (P-type)